MSAPVQDDSVVLVAKGAATLVKGVDGTMILFAIFSLLNTDVIHPIQDSTGYISAQIFVDRTLKTEQSGEW